MDATTSTLLILCAGVVAVIGGVLVLRLHAFLALTLGAVLVASLTPTDSVEEHALLTSRFSILNVDAGGSAAGEDSRTIEVVLGDKQWLESGTVLAALRKGEGDAFNEVARLRVDSVSPREVDGRERKVAAAVVTSVADSENVAEVRSTDVIVTPAARRSAASTAKQTVGQRVAEGFGSTCTKIGILIAMASIIGKCLLDSGAADRIVRSLLRLLGERGAPLSFLTSGFLLGIPVFFDTVFYLMIPLGKAMRTRTGRNYLLYVLTIVAGGTMAHSLVPPTPGPLFVAEQLSVDIGVMILAGGIVGLFTAGFGYVYAHVANRIWELPLRESPDLSLAELEAIARREEHELPPTWLALLPILLPVVLIGGNTVTKSVLDAQPGTWLDANASWIEPTRRAAATLGDKNIALILSAAIAMAMLVRQKRTNLGALSESMQAALASGGVIILITAAGGAFGGVLQQTGVAGLIGNLTTTSPHVIIFAAWLITAAIRTAQGSATVAMITSVGILSGLATSGSLGFHPVYLALAIGCGSKPIGWMNDSGFWVITKMSGMTEGEGLKYVTPMTSAMGVVGLGVTLAGVSLWPHPFP